MNELLSILKPLFTPFTLFVIINFIYKEINNKRKRKSCLYCDKTGCPECYPKTGSELYRELLLKRFDFDNPDSMKDQYNKEKIINQKSENKLTRADFNQMTEEQLDKYIETNGEEI